MLTVEEGFFLVIYPLQVHGSRRLKVSRLGPCHKYIEQKSSSNLHTKIIIYQQSVLLHASICYSAYPYPLMNARAKQMFLSPVGHSAELRAHVPRKCTLLFHWLCADKPGPEL